MRVLSRFLLAATDPAHFPPPHLPEIAFLGRSNVGKSSVINSLLGKKAARTSSTPGRTQSINFFEVRIAGRPQPEVVFADLPGYGYARVPREISSQWGSFIEPYLRQRSSLALCLVLIDINVPPQPSDRQLMDFLASAGRQFVVVATKSDRLSGNQLRNALAGAIQDYPQAEVVAFSARSGAGQSELWQHIRAAVENHRAVRMLNRA